MRDDDKRHGMVAGYRAGCREECCRRAIRNYNERRKVQKFRGLPTSSLVSATGTRRRVQALVALGWSMPYIAERSRIEVTYLRFILRENKQVTIETAVKVADCYRQLAMTLPPATKSRERQSVTRARRMAERKGWAPPLAWDDIDNDDSPYIVTKDKKADNFIDEVAVRRFVDGDMTVSLSRAERQMAILLWEKAGRSLNDLERRTGWNTARMRRQVAA